MQNPDCLYRIKPEQYGGDGEEERGVEASEGYTTPHLVDPSGKDDASLRENLDDNHGWEMIESLIVGDWESRH